MQHSVFKTEDGYSYYSKNYGTKGLTTAVIKVCRLFETVENWFVDYGDKDVRAYVGFSKTNEGQVVSMTNLLGRIYRFSKTNEGQVAIMKNMSGRVYDSPRKTKDKWL